MAFGSPACFWLDDHYDRMLATHKKVSVSPKCTNRPPFPRHSGLLIGRNGAGGFCEDIDDDVSADDRGQDLIEYALLAGFVFNTQVGLIPTP